MKKILTAIALSIAIPAVAHAQTAPAPAPKMECCEKMKAEGKECCCKDMAKMDHGNTDMKGGADAHAGHDKSQKAPPASHSNR
ncbi:MAG TPA: hypothetical protein VFK50_11360 [Sphingomicrobium sp.]|nr:hypothetical protein [Sphingomicrobium sp.]